MANPAGRKASVLGVLFLGAAGWASAQSELYVTNNQNNSVTVYASNASGNMAPLRTISPSTRSTARFSWRTRARPP